jgi:hypothetical protein
MVTRTRKPTAKLDPDDLPEGQDHPDNRVEDGYPLGLGRPIDQLTPLQAEAVANRHNLWTPRKMRRFLEALAQTCSVKAAAQTVGMSRQSAYRLRSKLVGEPFDMAWEAALEFGLQQLAHAALDRALNGVEEPIFHEGEQIGTRTRYDERLTMFLLANPAGAGRLARKRELFLHDWEGLLDTIQQGPLRWEELQKRVDERAEADPEFAMEKERLDDLTTDRIKDFFAHSSHYTARTREADADYAARQGKPKGKPSFPHQ